MRINITKALRCVIYRIKSEGWKTCMSQTLMMEIVSEHNPIIWTYCETCLSSLF